jgi:K+-transporting ATPase ATPase C chain
MRLVREAFTLLLVLSVLTGIVYPLALTGIAQVLFPGRADGSLLRRDGRIVGSERIGQPFQNPGYLWSRPSATSGQPYNAALSSGSNLRPLSEALAGGVAERIRTLRAQPGADPAAPVPIDLVTASGSGLDPHVSPAAAFYQVGRIAAARSVDPAEVRALVGRHVEGRQFGLLGEPRVNVLKVNLALDERYGKPAPKSASASTGPIGATDEGGAL